MLTISYELAFDNVHTFCTRIHAGWLLFPQLLTLFYISSEAQRVFVGFRDEEAVQRTRFFFQRLTHTHKPLHIPKWLYDQQFSARNLNVLKEWALLLFETLLQNKFSLF